MSRKIFDKDLTALKELVPNVSMQDVFDEVESVFGRDPALGKNVEMYLSQRYTGEKFKNIHVHFGIGESAVSQACRRIKNRIRSDKTLRRKIRKIKNRLNPPRMKTCPLFCSS